MGKIGCCGTLTAGVHGIKVKHHKSSTASNNIEGVSGGIENILGGGSMDYSE